MVLEVTIAIGNITMFEHSDFRDRSPEARLCQSYVAKLAGTSDSAQSKITVIPLR
jgi:hypothetical protein